MTECHHCKSAKRGESGLMGEGICNKVYHYAKKGSGIDQYSSGILQSGGFIRFICDDCLQYIHNVDLVMGEVQQSVNKNNKILAQYREEFKESLKHNETKIKKNYLKPLRKFTLEYWHIFSNSYYPAQAEQN